MAWSPDSTSLMLFFLNNSWSFSVTSITNIKFWGLIKLMSYYDDIAEGYDELHGSEQLAKLKIIAQYLQINKDTKLLDIGCGTGLSARVFDCNITGVDPAEKLLANCPFKTVKACAEKLPFSDNEFDVVIAVTSIHNFNDIEKGLKEIRRVGKNIFALTVLKKSGNKDKILILISQLFSNVRFLDVDAFDLICFCE
ncbi:methyltransferase domain-containing protein [Candidatus Woesearchaeota archaeon]|nr:methyltransferase domain-containing protein [Candidatus Woesearchaeota archaeon]